MVSELRLPGPSRRPPFDGARPVCPVWATCPSAETDSQDFRRAADCEPSNAPSDAWQARLAESVARRYAPDDARRPGRAPIRAARVVGADLLETDASRPERVIAGCIGAVKIGAHTLSRQPPVSAGACRPSRGPRESATPALCGPDTRKRQPEPGHMGPRDGIRAETCRPRYACVVSHPESPSLSANVLAALPAVDEMFADIAASPTVVRPSAYWSYINQCNLQQVERDGFDRFKRSINQNYFSFVPCQRGDDQYDSMRAAWRQRPTPAVLLPRRIDTTGLTTIFGAHNPLGKVRRQIGHARYIAMLWEFVRRGDRRDLLCRLEEPALGAPITIRYRGRHISQDLCNSVQEFYAATNGTTPASVMEIGGGYGRVAWIFLTVIPELRYVMCDIPPALAVAQRYLTSLFPDRPAFTFRRFTDYQDIASEFEAAKLAFVTPGQLARLPPQAVDLAINISSLHEMRRDQIAHYLDLIDCHCDGLFYTKQWIESVNERDGLVLHKADYPIPPRWREVYSRDHEIQTLFFEALYETT
jgi:putative sugar O-methyltransferase